MKPLSQQDLYELLEVPRDAPEAAIVRAWERAEALYGPGSLATYTLVSPEEAALLGRRLEEALAVLLDPSARRAYDAGLAFPAATPPLARGPTPARPATPPGAAPILLTRVFAPPPGGRDPGPPTSPPFAAATGAGTGPPATPPARRVAFLDEAAHFNGEQLRRARESRGISAEAMCARTRIPRRHLESLESDQHDRLPAPVYLRGYLMAIARELRLDGQKVVRSYLAPTSPGAEPSRPHGAKGR